jgi:C-terminal processing protease CtpA/Prc
MTARTVLSAACVVLSFLTGTALAAGDCRHAVAVPHAALCGVEVEKGEQGWLGVSITDVTDEVRKKADLPEGAQGVLVLEVYDGSPAEKAGVKDGDVIIEAAGKTAKDVAALVDAIQMTAPGTEVTVRVLRGGSPTTLKATLAEREEAAKTVFRDLDFEDLEGLEALRNLDVEVDLPWLELGLAGTEGRGKLGVYIDDLSEGLAEYFAVPDGKGALVEDVVEDSPAAKAGIRAGDVIIRVADERVGSVEDLREAIGDMEAGEPTAVVVWRNGKQQTLQATVEESEYAKAKRVYIGSLGDDAKMKAIYIGEHEEQLKETVEELRAQIEKLKEEIRDLKQEVKDTE